MRLSELNRLLQLKLDLERGEALAYVTHYWQTRGSDAEEFYRSKALPHLPDGWDDGRITWDTPFPPSSPTRFTFVDLFAGIGGMRLAAQALGGTCVFSSEWDDHAQRTYYENFGEFPFGDITKIVESDVPPHDMLFAGFPCQAFSIAGKRSGFADTRGTLFRDVARIIGERQPKLFLLENVKGLTHHDRGNTMRTILNVLRRDLGYYVPEPQLLNAKDFGVPQNRERIIIVGFHPSTGVTDFAYPEPTREPVTIADIKEDNGVSVKYYLSTQYLTTLREHRRRHEEAGHGFGYEIRQDDEIANAIVVGGMGRERNLVVDKRLKDFTPVTNIKGEVNREGIRRMTPREWARLQGFPDDFRLVVSDAQAYKQFGNSVAVPVIRAVASSALEAAGL